MKRIAVIFALIVFWMASFAPLATVLVADSMKAPRGFAGQLWTSTLALYGTKDGDTRFLCTAEPFEKIAGGYHLISAGHCVQLVPEGVEFSVAEEIGGPTTPVRVMKAYMGDGLDFAEFELKTDRKYTPFVLGDEHDSRVGDKIINPNFALGFGKQLSFGNVSSNILIASAKCPLHECSGSFLVQTYGEGGSSGSAVVSLKTHKVIGLIDWSYAKGNIGFGIQPISTFYTFLKGPNQPHPDSEEAKAQATAAAHPIPTRIFQALFGSTHPFILGVHGPNPIFTINGYTFQISTMGLELASQYYYDVPVFIDLYDRGYLLVSTAPEGYSVVADVVKP